MVVVVVLILFFFTRWVGDLGIESNSLEAAVQYGRGFLKNKVQNGDETRTIFLKIPYQINTNNPLPSI